MSALRESVRFAAKFVGTGVTTPIPPPSTHTGHRRATKLSQNDNNAVLFGLKKVDGPCKKHFPGLVRVLKLYT